MKLRFAIMMSALLVVTTQAHAVADLDSPNSESKQPDVSRTQSLHLMYGIALTIHNKFINVDCSNLQHPEKENGFERRDGRRVYRECITAPALCFEGDRAQEYVAHFITYNQAGSKKEYKGYLISASDKPAALKDQSITIPDEICKSTVKAVMRMHKLQSIARNNPQFVEIGVSRAESVLKSINFAECLPAVEAFNNKHNAPSLSR